MNNKFSYIEFIIEGGNFENLINALHYRNINIHKCHIVEKNKIKFLTLMVNTQKIIDLLENSCYTYTTRELYGVGYFLSKSIQNLGIILAVCIFFVFSIFYTNYIWKIDINIQNNVDNALLKQCLTDNGITIGIRKNSIDILELENFILQNVPTLSQVDISMIGASLVIHAKSKVQSEVLSQAFLPVVSQYDGKIENINLHCGTAVIKVGDVVKKGDILVQPYLINEFGQKKVCPAQATIEFTAYHQKSALYDIDGTSLTKTGKQTLINGLEFLGLKLHSNQNCDYKYFEQKESYSYLSNILPIKIHTTTYFELENIKNAMSVEEKLQSLKKELESELELDNLNDVDCIENTTKINDTLYNIVVTYTYKITQVFKE